MTVSFCVGHSPPPPISKSEIFEKNVTYDDIKSDYETALQSL